MERMQLARARDEGLARHGVPPRPDRAMAPGLHAYLTLQRSVAEQGQAG